MRGSRQAFDVKNLVYALQLRVRNVLRFRVAEGVDKVVEVCHLKWLVK